MKLGTKRKEIFILVMNRLDKRYRERFKARLISLMMDNDSEFPDIKSLEASYVYAGEIRTACNYTHPYSARSGEITRT